MEKNILLGINLSEMEQVIVEMNQPKYRAKQVIEWLYTKRVKAFDEMTNLPKLLREELERRYEIGRSEVTDRQVSKDGTEKYLYRVIKSTHDIETVYIPEEDRATLCVSSQVGCKMNCYFCHTGKMGFKANLSAADIVNQLLSAPHFDSLTNVVFMGMGEPLDNYDAVMRAIEIMTAPWGLAWSPKRITVSTIGLAGGVRRFLSEQQAHLAISIHSPYSEERLRLMPVERAFPISSVLKTLSEYDFSGQRRLSFEYIVFDGVNDSLRHADTLAKLLAPLDCRVNLIRYHAIPEVDLRSPSPERVKAFEQHLLSHNIRCTTRRSRGEDIFAACGMLSTKHKK